jgi:hypothetical protein
MTKKRKNVLVAFLLGLLLPGVGLLYAAPWLVAGLGTVATLLLYKLLGWIPLIGTVVMAVLALVSGALGALYARAYNRAGKRVDIHTAPLG